MPAFFRRQGDRGAGRKVELAGIEQVEGGVLQHLGIHRQVLERAVDKARHHRVGDGADAGLHRQQALGQAALGHFVLEEFDQVGGDGRGLVVGRQDGGGTVELLGDDDGDDFFGRISIAVVPMRSSASSTGSARAAGGAWG